MTAGQRRIVFWAPAVLALIGLLVVLFRPTAVPVDLVAVVRGPLAVGVADEGETRVRDMYVVSAPVPGRLRRTELEAGDPVVAGETVVARIEPSVPSFLDARGEAEAIAARDAAAAARTHAEAQVRRAEADLHLAHSDLARVQALARNHTVSESELDAAENRAATAEASVAEARAELEVRRSEYDATRARLMTPASRRAATGCDCLEVRSPVSGKVLRVITESEGVVQSGTPLVEVGDPDQLEVVVDLLSADAVQVHPGMRTVIEAWGGPRPLEGVVRRVEPFGFTKVSALGIEEQRVNVVIDIETPRSEWPRLGHGYRVEPRIVLWEARDVLKVPISALFREGSNWAVFVATGGRARLRTVTIGHQGGLEAEVTAGLREGERVVLHPGDRVAPGTRLEQRN